MTAVGRHPAWCDVERCESKAYPDGMIEIDHARRIVATVETELECRHVHRVWLSQLDVHTPGDTSRSTRSISLVGEDGSFGFTPRQAFALAGALLWAAVRMVVGR